TIDPERLHRIRSERRRHSAYASLNQCRKEITDAEALFRSERIRSLNVTSMSIEEIGSHLLQEMGLERRSF
ncbi:MAG: kinase/pyrophosphorylase, partial [Gammaproteobacteria bacterium]